MGWDERVMPLPMASLRPGVLNLVIVGVIINRGTVMKSGDNHKAFNLGFLLCFAPRNSWNENATLLMKFGVFFFLLITISQAVECQKIIQGFNEFSVTHRCVGQGPLWFWQLKKEAASPVRNRGSEDQVIDWDQRGKTSPPPNHEVAFTSFPFECSQNFVQSAWYSC